MDRQPISSLAEAHLNRVREPIASGGLRRNAPSRVEIGNLTALVEPRGVGNPTVVSERGCRFGNGLRFGKIDVIASRWILHPDVAVRHNAQLIVGQNPMHLRAITISERS